MKRYGIALILLGGLALVPSGQSSTTFAAARGPDLVITQIILKELPGDPPYIVVNHNDIAPNFIVKVTTKNIGNENAGRSIARLEINNNITTRIYRDAESVGPLTPGMYRRSTFHVNGLEPHLGHVDFQAAADVSNRVHETREHNNSKGAHLTLVVARIWKATQFQTKVTYAGGLPEVGVTKTANGFYFQLEPGRSGRRIFHYQPYGTVQATFDETGACTAHGQDSETKNPWIAANFELILPNRYAAYMATAQHPVETVPLYCEGQFVGNQGWSWSDLETVVDDQDNYVASMNLEDTQLTDHFEKDTPAGHVNWNWTFDADVVYH